MAQYIDKSALVAEIERRIESCAKERVEMLNVRCYTLADEASVKMGELNGVLSFLDTLEVKEEVITTDALHLRVLRNLSTLLK